MPESPGEAPLRILHALRTPVGGIFRHVIDLATGQAERGHLVGILTDSLTGGERADAVLADLAPRMRLGLHRMPIHRAPHPSDLLTWLRFSRTVHRLAPDVLHGHGAKTGVFVRLPGTVAHRIRVYTPHGGSVHFGPNTIEGRIYMALERALMQRTDLFLFESAFARDTLLTRIGGSPQGLVRTVFNGVTASEFDPVRPAPDATDVAYVGEFRHIKGTDLLIDAVARLHADGRPVTLTLGGDGEQTAMLKAQVERLGLQRAVRFIGHVKARQGFAMGRLLVVPSRGDSMPYVVIEAGAAGVPMVAADVGGIPEIFGPHTEALFANGSVGAMADAIETALAQPEAARERARALRERIFLQFSQKSMVQGVLAAYRDAFARR